MVAPALERSSPPWVAWLRSRGARATGRLGNVPVAVAIPLGFLILLAAACFLWPLVYHVPPPFDAPNPVPNLPLFSPGHILGTDPVGNDVLSRILYGGRVSLEVGFGVAALGLVVGGSVGVLAGFWAGAFDAVVMRVLDVLIAFPSLALALAVAEGLGPSELHVIWALAFFSVPAFARISRAATLRLRGQTYVLASVLSGTKTWRVMLRHLTPNVFPQLLTFGLLNVGVAIVIEGALDFLGLGIPPPTPSWGGMIALGQQNLSSNPSLLLVPSAFLLVTVLALNRLGDALRAWWGAA